MQWTCVVKKYFLLFSKNALYSLQIAFYNLCFFCLIFCYASTMRTL